MNDSRVSVGVGKVQMHLQSSQNRIFIKGGKVVNDDRMFDADVYVEDGVIKQVGTNLMVPGGVRTVEARGKLIIPGGVDPNTHFHSPLFGTKASDDFYSGTKAALAGGTTTIIDCVFVKRGQSLVDAYTNYRASADPAVCCDYGLRVLVPQFSDTTAKQMETLVKESGVNAFLGCMAFRDRGVMLEDDEIYDVMRECRRLGALAQVHAENGKIIEKKANELFEAGITGPEGHLYSRSEETEYEATNRAILLSSQARCPLYLVNQTSALAAARVSEARRHGTIVFGETTAAALACPGDGLQQAGWRQAAGHVTFPPLRGQCDKLLGLLSGGGGLDCVSSQHCVFRGEQKALGKDDFRLIPAGVNGVQERMAVLWEKGVMGGHIDPCKFVALTSTNAAKVFNIYPRKGRIEPGSDADLVLWDGATSREISSRDHLSQSDFNVFEGCSLRGVAELVIAGGRVVLEESGGQLRVTQGAGRYLSAAANNPYLFARLNARDQATPLKPVSREAYTGAVIDISQEAAASLAHGTEKSARDEDQEKNKKDEDLHNRPPTRSGGRHMQDSSFSFSGAQYDDSRPARSGIRTHQPPGGSSSQPFW